MKYWLIALFTGLLLTTQTQAAKLEGRVLNILSGDTLEIIATNQRSYIIQLNGIESPKTDTTAGRVAKKHLAMLVAGKQLIINYHNIGRKGVLFGTIELGGSDINLRQISDGMARVIPKVLSAQKRSLYQTRELKARQEKRGIWRLSKSQLGRDFL
ncbi:MAG: thermonuclease family protein [Candidatus Polarisedimenticolaceae bacterium]|nr:thermonuclease family protein [Candidatus Polarisedimenticolaceae bacterium]